MPYMDIQIIPRRMAAKKNRELNIANEVVINDVSYRFERVCILEIVSVILPTQWMEMDAEAAKMKYPSVYRPQCIFTSDDGSINLSFDLVDYPLEKNQIEGKMLEWKTSIKRLHPSFVYLTEKTAIQDDRKIGYFDCKSYALDADLYNLIFLTNVRGKLLLGSFNCPYERYKDWKRLVIQMLLTVQEIPDNEARSVNEGGER